MTFTEQPDSIVGCNSPIIYQAYDGNYAVTNFNYVFKLYVWSGGSSLPVTPRCNHCSQTRPIRRGKGMD